MFLRVSLIMQMGMVLEECSEDPAQEVCDQSRAKLQKNPPTRNMGTHGLTSSSSLVRTWLQLLKDKHTHMIY